jgi:hypothetical protein
MAQAEPVTRMSYAEYVERGVWELHEAGAGESIELASLGVNLSVDAVYEDPLAPAPLGAPISA